MRNFKKAPAYHSQASGVSGVGFSVVPGIKNKDLRIKNPPPVIMGGKVEILGK
jgi:hypothetical protein